MTTESRPELKQPVVDFLAKLASGADALPLADLALLFGARGGFLDQVKARGDIVLKDGTFSNDGPEITLPAGQVEVELPMLVRGNWSLGNDGIALTFPMAEFAPRACIQIAILRKCFELKGMRATPTELVLDFGNEMIDRRYTF